MEIRVRTANLL